MLNDLILNFNFKYWQIKGRFEKDSHFRLIIYIWYCKKKKMISQERKDLALWKLKSNICRLSGILECSFWGYKMREMLLDFVYGVCFPLALSTLLKCSKLYSSTRVLGKYSNSWVPRKENIAENYFFHVHFIIQKLLITIFNDSVFNYNNIRDVFLNVFQFLYDIQLMTIWINIEYFEYILNIYWIF